MKRKFRSPSWLCVYVDMLKHAILDFFQAKISRISYQMNTVAPFILLDINS